MIKFLAKSRVRSFLKANPVLIGIDSYDYPVDKLKFPAITVCPKQSTIEHLKGKLNKRKWTY